MEDKYLVRVIEYDSENIVKEFGPYFKRKADKIAAGLEINLNHVTFYVCTKKVI